ncbi:MAG: hypothetical protein GXP47_14220 [Acidobacteria bacterium]|nr:hypothetical protein [Acidobacteriota bacterium]
MVLVGPHGVGKTQLAMGLSPEGWRRAVTVRRATGSKPSRSCGTTRPHFHRELRAGDSESTSAPLRGGS